MKLEELTISELKSIKDAILSKEQGEALRRITKPETEFEQIGLGFFGPETVLALASVNLIEHVINDLTGLTDMTLHSFTGDIGVASGSRGAKRMEKSLETIGSLGPHLPDASGHIPTPTALESPAEKG